MEFIQTLEKRRSYYNITEKLPVKIEEVERLIKQTVALVPDAFNMKSARVVTVFGEKHNLLWDSIYEVFGGKVPREKIDSFKAGAGTVLFFYDEKTVKTLQEKFASYAANFPVWANQANGMLQFAVWTALREAGIGASLQHYNPIIDETVKSLFSIPEEYVMIAQMPFGGIGEEPKQKEKEDIEKRVRTIK